MQSLFSHKQAHLQNLVFRHLHCAWFTEMHLSRDTIKTKNDGNKSILINAQLQDGRNTVPT